MLPVIREDDEAIEELLAAGPAGDAEPEVGRQDRDEAAARRPHRLLQFPVRRHVLLGLRRPGRHHRRQCPPPPGPCSLPLHDRVGSERKPLWRADLDGRARRRLLLRRKD